MENWCTNKLTKLDKSPIEEIFNKYITAEVFDFTKILQPPPLVAISRFLAGYRIKSLELPDQTKLVLKELVDTNDWYTWCSNNWGVKASAGILEMTEWDITFQTAWSPPIRVIAELSKLLNVPLRMTYVEEGMGFCGETTFTDGVVCDKLYDAFDAVPDELREELGLSDLSEEDEEED